MSAIANKERKDPQPADWVHLIRLLKILMILFISFSSFHWFVIKRVENLPASSTLSQTSVQKGSSTKIYTVKDGDTLWKIAYKQYPKQNPLEVVKEIQKINGMKSDTIKTGQPLKLP